MLAARLATRMAFDTASLVLNEVFATITCYGNHSHLKRVVLSSHSDVAHLYGSLAIVHRSMRHMGPVILPIDVVVGQIFSH